MTVRLRHSAQGVQSGRISAAGIGRDARDDLFLEGVGRQGQDLVHDDRGAIAGRAILRRSIQRSVMDEGRSSRAAGADVGLERVRRVGSPWPRQFVRMPAEQFEIVAGIRARPKKPPPAVVLEDCRIDNRRTLHQGRFPGPRLAILGRAIENDLTRLARLRDAVEIVADLQQIGIGQMARQLDRGSRWTDRPAVAYVDCGNLADVGCQSKSSARIVSPSPFENCERIREEAALRFGQPAGSANEAFGDRGAREAGDLLDRRVDDPDAPLLHPEE